MKAYPCHDRQKVEVCYDDGVDQITVAEAKKVIRQLEKAVAEVEKRDAPPGPNPLTFSDVGHEPEGKNNEFTYCGPRETEFKVHLAVGGYEMDLDGIKKLRDWCTAALIYHGVEK